MLHIRLPCPRAVAPVPARVAPFRPAIAAQARIVVAKAVEAPVAPVSQITAEAGDLEEARAHLRYIRGSPNKVRRVLDAIRGLRYEEALGFLEFMPYRACKPILKLLMSAASNAKHNLGLRKAKLIISECYCDEGPTLKRFRNRAQGRAYKIRKRMSHITIKVAEKVG